MSKDYHLFKSHLHYINSLEFFLSKGNLPDPGKAQDFVKKLAQVLDDDERIRDQLETLVSPTCSCKQAEVCVVSINVYVCITLSGYGSALLIMPVFVHLRIILI